MTKNKHKLVLLNTCRVKDIGDPQWQSDCGDGMNGAFLLPFTDKKAKSHRLFIIASDGEGWEHVSVTDQTTPTSHLVPPTWEMMCRAKRAFWDDDECVMQLHVPQSEWIDCHSGCLHLWKPIGREIPRPPNLMVGI